MDQTALGFFVRVFREEDDRGGWGGFKPVPCYYIGDIALSPLQFYFFDNLTP